jgi:hypothetical protein
VQLGDRFDYYFVATDVSGNANITRLPATGWYSFVIINSIVFDFEPDDGNLTTVPFSDWEWGVPASGPQQAHSGTRLWATKLAGNYSDYSDSRLDLPPIDLTGVTQPALRFWHWYRMEFSSNTFWDGGNVKISVNGGPFEIITPLAGYDGAINAGDPVHALEGEPIFGGPAGNGNFWQQEVFDLSPYANQDVVIRFHFGSDAAVTEPGWYLDDVEITLSVSTAPFIINTTRWRNTSDKTGPYLVSSQIRDDGGIAEALLKFSADNGASYTSISMNPDSADVYQAGIPGQSAETRVRYYVEARDETGNVTRDPANAPAEFFEFIVTDRVPQIAVSANNFLFNLAKGDSAADSLVVANRGLIDLSFTAYDSLPPGQLHANKAGVLMKKGSRKDRRASTSWLQLGLTEGVVAGESEAAIPFSVHAVGLEPGTYHAFIVIHSNDPDNPATIVAVDVVVMSTAVDERNRNDLPRSFALLPGQPNPFRNETFIRYQLPVGITGEIKLEIFNVLGQRIKVLAQGAQSPGFYSLSWNGTDEMGRNVPAGIYFTRLEGRSFAQVQKLVIVR